MGLVIVVGTHWLMRGVPSWQALLVSLPIAVMVGSILYYQSIPDMETDAAVGKRTLTVRLGRKRAVTGLWAQWAAVWLLILALVAGRVLSPWALLSLLTVPMLVRLLGIIAAAGPGGGDWRQLDRHGGIVRRLYLANGLVILLAIRA
jgi:1,4-dihydroxy-2-naphthoate octaprenyltransferase